ncbi:alanine racemase [Caulobacter sp. RHG1]|uniref:alanine racemase n=1 Tax=Caulobacter sp. (strain RHG1) TaxID=2545762 RepID=UPI0019D61DE7|nr:alanine racemase [Caulobacter sp. RHG1]NQE64721.1 Alanine racemase [Caulobacter sp. RHG1]
MTHAPSRDMAGGLLTIDLAALTANYLDLARRVSPSRTAAVVKADAYGLGASCVASALEGAGCQDFFVAHLEEALALKSVLSPNVRLYVLNGLQPGAEAACAKASVIPVLNGLDQAWRWRDLAMSLGAPLPAAIQIDSGMARLGLSAADLDTLLADAAFFSQISLMLVMSHLACSDEPEAPSNEAQQAFFARQADRLPPAPRSLANSGGIFLGAAHHADLVRPGVSLYGVAPNDAPNPMRAVVRLDAKVIQVRDIAAGDRVGYGLTYAREAPGRIATIAVGYADGWPRHLSNAGAAYSHGVRLPIAGRVSMDSITLDVSALAGQGLDLKLGDLVELLGPHQTLEDVARAAGTIPYEILTGLGRRYHRTYVEDTTMSQLSVTPRQATVFS